MKRRTPPAIDTSRLQPVSGGAAFLRDAVDSDIRAEDLLFQNEDFTGADLSGLAASGCVFHGCRFTAARLRRATLADCEFNSCEFSGCDIADARLSRLELRGCKLAGAIFGGGYLQDVLFADCVAPGANLSETRQFFTEIQRGNFSAADFTDSELKGFDPQEVDFSRANFFRTSLKWVNLAGCRIDALGVALQSQELRGCKMDFTQLAELAALLGIELV